MFYKYLLTNDGKENLFLYIVDSFEFAKDYGKKDNNKNIYEKTYDYIKDNKIKFKGDKVYFVKEGNTLGSINLSDYDYFHHSYVEIIDNGDNKFVFKGSRKLIDDIKVNEYILRYILSGNTEIREIEALKANAIVYRTNIYNKLSKGLIIGNFNVISDFEDKEYLNTVIRAIKDTTGEVITYNNDLIDAYYHLASNTKTEDSSNILKFSYPYLVSVDSSWDNKEPDYKIIPNSYLSKLLNMEINKNTKVEVIIKTNGNRIKYIKFDDLVFDGLILGKRLGLDSYEYKIDIKDNYTVFTVYGVGSGLGLSIYGAISMAKNGYNYKQILEHYYPNTSIDNVNI